MIFHQDADKYGWTMRAVRRDVFEGAGAPPVKVLRQVGGGQPPFIIIKGSI